LTVTIRPAAPGDAATVLRFTRELAAFEREPDAVVATEEMMDEALFGDRPAAEALIAEIDGEAVGFALFFHNFSTWMGRRGIWLDDLYVTPAARGAGIGGRLLARLAQIAVERNCARLEWWVLDWNEPAINVYDSLGAETMSEWTVRRLSGDTLAALAARG
jgi:GNAT superfamily N-acetyltransferase